MTHKYSTCSFFTFCFILLFTVTATADCNGRYSTTIFSNFDLASDIQYGQNILSNGATQDLYFDIYTGSGDQETNRPVVIMAHGGSFTGGNKTDGHVVEFCEDLAMRGYVALSIQYRIETNPIAIFSEEPMVKAVMRAVQDGKAMVRFLRENALDGGNIYGIDPNQIYIGGVSAGAILALHVAYMDDINLLSTSWQSWSTSLGGLEGSSGTPGYDSRVQGVINISGALADSIYLQPGHYTTPFISFHSEDDGTVNYGIGYPLNVATLPNLYGSYVLKHRADLVGIYNPFFSFIGIAHPPFLIGASFDPTILTQHKEETANFLYSTLPCNPNNIFSGNTGIPEVLPGELHVYPNPASSLIQIDFPSGLGGEYRLEILDAKGQTVLNKGGMSERQVNISSNELNTGIYYLNMTSVKNPLHIFTGKMVIQ